MIPLPTLLCPRHESKRLFQYDSVRVGEKQGEIDSVNLESLRQSVPAKTDMATSCQRSSLVLLGRQTSALS